MEKISWTDSVRNGEQLHRVKEDKIVLNKQKKANWIGNNMHRRCLLKHVIGGKTEGRIEVTGRRGGRRKYILEDLKEQRGYWILKRKQRVELDLEEAVDLSQGRLQNELSSLFSAR